MVNIYNEVPKYPQGKIYWVRLQQIKSFPPGELETGAKRITLLVYEVVNSKTIQCQVPQETYKLFVDELYKKFGIESKWVCVEHA